MTKYIKEKISFSTHDLHKMLFAFYSCIKYKKYEISKYKEELKIIEEVMKKINSTIADDDQLTCEHFDELNLYFMKIINNLILSNDEFGNDKMAFKESFSIKEFEDNNLLKKFEIQSQESLK